MGYYQGDFYSGDPGFLSGLGKVFGTIGSFLPGVGGIISKGVSALGRMGKSPAVQTIEKGISRHPVLTAAGGAATSGVAGALTERAISRMGGGGALATRGATMRGFHMSKPYKCHGTIIPSHPVRNRRMRPTNPRALRRAIRRAKGFERLARKVMHFVSPRKTRGRAVFRVRRRTK